MVSRSTPTLTLPKKLKPFAEVETGKAFRDGT